MITMVKSGMLYLGNAKDYADLMGFPVDSVKKNTVPYNRKMVKVNGLVYHSPDSSPIAVVKGTFPSWNWKTISKKGFKRVNTVVRELIDQIKNYRRACKVVGQKEPVYFVFCNNVTKNVTYVDSTVLSAMDEDVYMSDWQLLSHRVGKDVSYRVLEGKNKVRTSLNYEEIKVIDDPVLGKYPDYDFLFVS